MFLLGQSGMERIPIHTNDERALPVPGGRGAIQRGQTMSRTRIVTVVKWLATLFIPLGIQLVPASDSFPAPMREFLVSTIFVILLAAFELLPNMLVGLLLPVAYVVTGTVPVADALGIWSGSFMIFMIVGGMIFANALDESGLLNRMVLWAGTKCRGSLLKLLMALMVAGLLVMVVSFTNGWMVTLVLCYGVVKALKLEHTNEGILIMIVAQIVSTASLNFIYSPVSVGLWGGGVKMVVKDFEMTWWTLTVYNLPLIVIQFILVYVFYKLYKPAAYLKGGTHYFETEYAKLGRMTTREKKAILLTGLLFLYIFTQPWHKLDMNYGFIIIPMLFFLPGIQVATRQKSLDTVNIGFIIFIASCMSIGYVGAVVGIGPAISKSITPMLEGCPIPVFLFLCIIFGIIMNVLMTPSAMQGMFPGPLAALGTGLGIGYPLLPFMAMFFANDMVFFPYENAYLLVMFGFGVMSMKDFMKYNLIKMVLTLVLFWVLVLPYWYLMGLI